MTHLLRLVEVTSGVWVAQSRRYATNSTVLLDGHGGALVIDPSWDPDELAAIPADLASLGVRCVAGLSTHVHYDHVMWHPDLGDVPRWATPGTIAMVDADRDGVVAPLRGDLPDDLVDLAARDLRPIDGELLEWTGPTAVVHVHHAHAPHHLALELPDLGLLVAGDMLSDIELPMPDKDDTDLANYLGGLERLRGSVSRSHLLVPGHGSVSSRPMERYDADARYLDAVVRLGASDDTRIADMADLHAANLERAANRMRTRG
ncbi:MBL fold metallo-hydrolase [Longivirga aurantiaca]|uniref:MBL fold metallo-hydrolase n=1 Tax=Longivirga aurantiaca TaxID=1837743 RepID=A0ABW1SYH4_9ACTN